MKGMRKGDLTDRFTRVSGDDYARISATSRRALHAGDIDALIAFENKYFKFAGKVALAGARSEDPAVRRKAQDFFVTRMGNTRFGPSAMTDRNFSAEEMEALIVLAQEEPRLAYEVAVIGRETKDPLAAEAARQFFLGGRNTPVELPVFRPPFMNFK